MGIKRKIPPKYLGIFFIVLSALFFAFMNAFVKLSGDLPTVQKAFFRNFVAFIIAAVTLAKDRISIVPPKKAVPSLLLRAIAGTLGIFCNFYAIDKLSVLSDASILNKMSPFFAVLFSIFILKEKAKPIQLITICIAFVGAIFVIQPSFTNMEMIPSIIGFMGGMFAGLAYTFVRKLTLLGVKGAYVVFFFSGFSCLVTIPFLIYDFAPMTLQQVIFLLLAGISAAGGQFTITAAYAHSPAREISVYDYSQVVFAGLLSVFMFSTYPDILSIIGYVIIVSMAVLSFLYNNKLLFFKSK